MAASIWDIARLRRMVAEPTSDTYDDAVLTEAIERYPKFDSAGLSPDDTDWTATYDLYSAASEIWDEKAAALVGNYDFSADGSSFSRSQAYNNALRQSRYHAARRSITTVSAVRDIDTELDTE